MGLDSRENIITVESFDGQTIRLSNNLLYIELGNYLGGGAAGNVYECEKLSSNERFAIKILNPIGYKLLTPLLLRKCNIIKRGKLLNDNGCVDQTTDVQREHIWWLSSSSSKQFIAAYYSQKLNCLKELSLPECIKIWGLNIQHFPNSTELEGANNGIPNIPPKFVEFIKLRSNIFKEIENMRKISHHPNVIKLEEVLEFTQDSKSTTFLLMELANGGELFDRIKVDCGTREETALYFFRQLLEGIKHCHDQHICHRDLKPENLLLQDLSDTTILKIADFGFSARVITRNESLDIDSGFSSFIQLSSLKMLKSIVGSPFYVAPEILKAQGYDGMKADVWSLGVIFYAMLAGSLPFGQDLNSCKRFKTFCKWIAQYEYEYEPPGSWNKTIEYPDWLFPSKFSAESKELIVSMLHPDPKHRVSLINIMKHPIYLSNLKEDNQSDVNIIDQTFNLRESDGDSDIDQSGMFVMEEDVVENLESNSLCAATDSRHQTEAFDENFVRLSLNSDYNCFNRLSYISETEVTSSFNSNHVKPPLAPLNASMEMLSDLITNSPRKLTIDDVDDEEILLRSRINRHDTGHLPSFNDSVKRSTRFVTAVPATQVISKIESILMDCHTNQIHTPIGYIGRVVVNWSEYLLEVWGTDTSSPPVFALSVFQLSNPQDFPLSASVSSRGSESILARSPQLREKYIMSSSDLFLIEFQRGQIDIFSFKRFYEWIRSQLSALVKKDYLISSLESS